MGRACRICDRKFFLRASFCAYATKINFYASEAAAVEEKLKEVNTELDEIND